MIVVLKNGTTEQAEKAIRDRIVSEGASCREVHDGHSGAWLVDGVPDREALAKWLEGQPDVERLIALEDDLQNIDRRSFFDFLILGAGGVLSVGVLGAMGLFSIPPSKVLDPAGEVAIKVDKIGEGGSKNFMIRHKPAILVESYGNYYAMASTCTHSDICAVEWNREKQQLICPCHRGVFDVRGNVLEGPPPRALQTFKVAVKDGKIFISELD